MQKIKIIKNEKTEKNWKKPYTYRNDAGIQENFVNICKKKGYTYSIVLQQLTEKIVNGEIEIE